MKIIKTKIPENSLLYPDRNRYSYIDSYQGNITEKNNTISIVDVAKVFIKPGPKCIGFLLVLRNKIVSVFGLKNDIGDTKHPESFKFEPGEQAGLFRVFIRTNDEIILGEDDKHLNFRVSLFLQESGNNKSNKIVTVTTIVIYNNWFGQLYFFMIKPFHKLIVTRMLKKNLQELELNS